MKSLAFSFATLLAIQPATAQLVQEGPEPNHSAATATFLPLGQQAFGALDSSNQDVDWYKITLPSRQDIKVWTGPGVLHQYQAQDTVVSLYRGDGVTLIGTVDNGDPFQTGFYASFTSGDLAAGDYYLAVTGGPFRQQGYYTLDVVAGPLGSLVPVRFYNHVIEGAEQNDPRRPGGIATATTINSLTIGRISAGGNGQHHPDLATADYDLYQLQVTEPMRLTFDLLITNNPGESQAPILYLLDSYFQLIDTSYPVGSGGIWDQLVYDFQVPTVVYLAVAGWDATGVGTYVLRTNGPIPPIVAPSTVLMHPGGCAGSAGVPRLGVLDCATTPASYAERPVLGSTYTLTGTNLPVNTPLVRIVSLVTAPVPIDLGLYGAPGCTVVVDPASTALGFADSSGQDYWALPLPFLQPLIGLPLEQQLLVMDPAANALGLTTSNRVSSVCGLTH